MPGRDISASLVSVRNEVVKATNGRQVPWEHTSLMGQVVLAGGVRPEPPTVDYDKEMEIAFWNAIKDSRSPELLQTYIDRFPRGTFAGLARVLIDQQTAHQEVARREGELKRAEEARGIAERQQREAERKAAESKLAAELKKTQDEARKAREALLAAEREREAALKAAEQARRVQEETRKATETVVASIPSRPATAGQAETGLAEQAALIRSIQRELRRVGCDPGREDGKWGPGVTGALNKYNRLIKSALQTDGPTRDALAAIAGRKGRACPLECGAGERIDGDRCVAVSAPKRRSSATGEASRSPAPPKSKQSELQACIQCCETFGPAIGGGGCASLCFSRSPRIESCLR